MTEQELDEFYSGLENLYEYFKDYSLQDIYDTLIVSGLFDLSSEEDLDFVESFSRKIYYGRELYFRLYMPQYEKGQGVQLLGDIHREQKKFVKHKYEDEFHKFIEENGFANKSAKEILDELSNKWKEL